MAKAGLVQMLSGASLQNNLHSLLPIFAQAQEQQVKLLVLPENFAMMGMKETDKLQSAEAFGQGKTQEFIQTLAKKFGIWVIAGTIPIQSSSSRVKASSMVYDDQGQCVARYDKIHLFDVEIPGKETYHESSAIEAGNDPVVVDTPIGRVGLSVCYDLRFPELYRALVLKGAEILVAPSAFTQATGAAHWEVLLRARAIENLCYVLAPNQGGQHENGRCTYGHSMMVDPWGKVIANQLMSLGLITAEIDLAYLRTLRQVFPCLQHRILF